jgi:hypothetical protein
MRSKNIITSIIIIGAFVMVMSACGVATKTTGISTDSVNDELPPVAAIKAREMLAEKLAINIEEISITSHDQMIWSDSCLGLGGPADSCLVAEVEGWLVVLTVDGKTHNARTDWLGDQIRFEP